MFISLSIANWPFIKVFSARHIEKIDLFLLGDLDSAHFKAVFLLFTIKPTIYGCQRRRKTAERESGRPEIIMNMYASVNA